MFKKYQHIERLGTPEVEGIENGMCYIFPKIDGTNASVWAWGCGSRNRELSEESDNAGFYKYASKNENIVALLENNKHLRLYGEWLVPHALKTYADDAWRHFYVFDVMDGDRYLSYDEYQPLLELYGIDYIPPICRVENPTYERIMDQIEKNGFLIKDGQGVGEGLVIKRYDYVNKYGRTTWAKVVTNEFKTLHRKKEYSTITEKAIVEQSVVNKYITASLIEKEMAKIGEFRSKDIPRLLNTVYYCLITEESWHFIKEFKNPTINFKTLNFMCTNKIKELKPELF